MSGSVKKYGPTWRIRWDVGRKADGTRIQRSKGGFATKKDAEKALKIRLSEVERGQLLGRVEDDGQHLPRFLGPSSRASGRPREE